ncbi:MAG: hypothetical protein WDN46_14855 [Methylocella sp.]
MEDMFTVWMKFSASMIRGFAQMGSFGQNKAELPKRANSVSEALHQDWVKVGSDLSSAERRYRRSLDEKIKRAG